MGQDKQDLESLLPHGLQTPPKEELLQVQEESRLIFGLSVQLVAGSAYCAGQTHQMQSLFHMASTQI